MRAVAINDLQPGMVLARTLVNNDMIVVLSENTVLTKAHITRLNFLKIPAVYIKDDRELTAQYRTADPIIGRSNAFVREYDGVVTTAERMFAEAKKGQIILGEATSAVKEKLIPLVKNSGAIDHLYALNHLASDVYNHSLRVSILSGVIAKWLRFSLTKTRDIILAGFLHDIGKSNFDRRLLEKNVNTLKGADYEDYIAHTVEGSSILSAEDVSEGVKYAAFQHHERLDGSGFPYGTSGDRIHEYARIIAVADIYDNITTERVGYPKQTPFAAIQYFTENMYSKLDPAVCVPVLNHIKDAFLGSRVTLSDGRAGMVAAFPHGIGALPVISITPSKYIDLNKFPSITINEYNPKS